MLICVWFGELELPVTPVNAVSVVTKVPGRTTPDARRPLKTGPLVEPIAAVNGATALIVRALLKLDVLFPPGICKFGEPLTVTARLPIRLPVPASASVPLLI